MNRKNTTIWKLTKGWLYNRYYTVVNTIAFYPAFIAVLLLALAIVMVEFDYSETGKHMKATWHLLSLKDASTARSIISSIAAGILSLSVFSFSMVMIVLNQAASQMSNRVLDKLIGNRFQQIVLGIYIGTIVYAFFLLSTIRDVDSGIYIPALSTYTLIFLTIFDIFLFIYFLHYITQTVKYEIVIARIYKDTENSLQDHCQLTFEQEAAPAFQMKGCVMANTSGIYEGFNSTLLMDFCVEHNLQVSIPHTQGTFLLKGFPLLDLSTDLSEELKEKIKDALYIRPSESIEGNFYYGFRQLTEVAIKALSPGINDPGTAIVSMRALFKLFAKRICSFPATSLADQDSHVRIFTKEHTFDDLVRTCLLPIWDYGKQDRLIQQEMLDMLTQLSYVKSTPLVEELLHVLKAAVKKKEWETTSIYA